MDFGEPRAAVIPAAAIVVEAFLDNAVVHVLEVDAFKGGLLDVGWSSVRGIGMGTHRTCGPEVLNTVHAMSVPGIAGPRLDIFSQFPLSAAFCEYVYRERRT